MGESTEILIEIKGSAKEFVEALEGIKGSAATLQNQLKFAAATSAIAFAALTAEIGLSVAAYAKEEKATNSLVQSLQNQGIYSKELVESYRAQAEAIEEKTGIDAEQIVKGQALIQGMIGQTEVSKELTQAAVDLSVKTGSVESAFQLLGQGIQGHTKGLKLAGITIDESLPKQERLAKILELVTQKYNGQAEAQAQGIGGLVRLEAAFENIQKKIGAEFAPVITKVTDYITEMLNAVAKNKPLLDIAVGILAAGVAATGFVAVLSGLGVAFIAATHLAAAFGFTLTVALGPIGLASVAIGALAGAIALYTLHSKDADNATKELEHRISNAHDSVARYKSIVDHPTGRDFIDKDALKNLEKAQARLAELEAQLGKIKKEAAKVDDKGQDTGKKALAEKEQKEEDDREARKVAALKAHNQVIKLESEDASKQTIELKKAEAEILDKIADDKYKSSRADLQRRLAEVRSVEESQNAEDLQRTSAFQSQVLDKDKEFQSLSASEKNEFLLRNRATLTSELETERTARENAAKTRAQDQIKQHNVFLTEQQKYGTAFATINKFIQSEEVQGTKKATSELTQLTQSKNETLKAIGKASSIANIVIKTAESAMNIYSGFSILPFIGPALGIAGAAAAIAFGGEQIGTVVGAAQGGLITGGVPGMDSVHGLLMPGELVVPTKNYDEVINSVSSSRNQGQGQNRQSQESFAHIEISLKGQLMDFIEAKLVERKSLGLSLQGA